jgi:hypothetical protein
MALACTWHAACLDLCNVHVPNADHNIFSLIRELEVEWPLTDFTTSGFWDPNGLLTEAPVFRCNKRSGSGILHAFACICSDMHLYVSVASVPSPHIPALPLFPPHLTPAASSPGYPPSWASLRTHSVASTVSPSLTVPQSSHGSTQPSTCSQALKNMTSRCSALPAYAMTAVQATYYAINAAITICHHHHVPQPLHRYDKMSARESFRQFGVTNAAYEQFLKPTLLVGLFAPPEQLSAAVTIETLYFYALAHQNDFDVCWCNGSVTEKIFVPLVARLKDLGAKILVGCARYCHCRIGVGGCGFVCVRVGRGGGGGYSDV